MSKIISLHSFRRGAGKSNVAANLAVVLARAGGRVAVVDADREAPSQQVLFDLPEMNEANTVSRGTPEALAVEVTERLGLAGRLWVVPTHAHRSLARRPDHPPLGEALQTLGHTLQADWLVVDTPAGLDEAVQQVFAATDVIVTVVCYDQVDFQGAAVVVDVARHLEVPRLLLVLNRWPAQYDEGETRARLEATYGCEVAAVIPFWDELAALGGTGLFVWRYPQHPLTQIFGRLAARLAE